MESRSGVGKPKFMQPRHRTLTGTPVRPKLRYCIALPHLIQVTSPSQVLTQPIPTRQHFVAGNPRSQPLESVCCLASTCTASTYTSICFGHTSMHARQVGQVFVYNSSP